MMLMFTNKISTSLFVYLLTLYIVGVPVTRAGLQCNSNLDCQSRLITPGVSICENGECTNPFEDGCLKVMAEKYGKKDDSRFSRALEMNRICNSDDKNDENNQCRKSPLGDIFTYEEVRIAPGKRISSVFFSWIYQILLTELMEVPSTLEHGGGRRGDGSFYDRVNGFNTVNTGFEENVVDALLEANNQNGNCQTADKPCAHIMPDVWANDEVYQDYIDNDQILPPTPNGMIRRLGFYVPAHTAIENPELSSLFGLKTEKNSKKLAETFLTPTTWKSYCDMYDCQSAGDVAKRAPFTEEEGKKYFDPKLFRGYFHNSTEMGFDCEKNPNEEYCFGHFVNVDNTNCEWDAYAEAQLHWNEIGLRSRGPESVNNGYSHDSMLEIWQAAYETNNNVLMWWWYPDLAIQRYEGTKFKFHRINFPRPTEACLEYRRKNVDFCSTNATERLGASNFSACDYPVENPQKYMSQSLKKYHDLLEPSRRSPAYIFLNQVEIPTYAMEEIFENLAGLNKNFSEYESRETVCKWVYDNFDLMKWYVPLSYPKKVIERRNESLVIAAYSIASVALAALLVVAVFTYKFQETKVFKYAQVPFLFWMIAGSFLVSIGAMTSADVVSNASCVITEWSLLIGYTLELAPLLVKIQAINTIAREALSFHHTRIRIDTVKLKTYPILFAIPVVAYLIVWVCLDMPVIIDTLEVEPSKDGRIVELNRRCSSELRVWSIMTYVWLGLLLLISSVLAFQSRDVLEELNESQCVGFLAYSHLMFLIFRIVIRGLSINEAILGSVASSAESLILSLDVLVGVAIYFGPKFYSILTMSPSANRASNGTSSERRSSVILSSTSIGHVSEIVNRISVIRTDSVVTRNETIPQTNNTESTTVASNNTQSKELEEKPEQEENSPMIAFPVATTESVPNLNVDASRKEDIGVQELVSEKDASNRGNDCYIFEDDETNKGANMNEVPVLSNKKSPI